MRSIILYTVIALLHSCAGQGLQKEPDYSNMSVSLKDTVYAYQVSPEVGKENLKNLLQSYPGLKEWEERKKCLQEGLLKAMELFPLPEKTPLNTLFTACTDLGVYSVENVAFECIPGVWVTGNLYRPSNVKGTIPAVLLAHGHFGNQSDLDNCPRFLSEHQCLAASLARMGAVVFAWDMFAYGESAYHAGTAAHKSGLSQTLQIWSAIRSIDFLLTLPYVDATRIAMTGASGGGTQTFLTAAVDDRIAVSAPAIQVSCFFPGGCACESGRPIHNQCIPPSNNVEIAALAAPRPQLLISDGNDWTRTLPEVEYPHIRTIYGYYGKKDKVENAHFPNEGHDYGYNKRSAAYRFLASHLNLNLTVLYRDSSGDSGSIGNSGGSGNEAIDESGYTVLTAAQLAVFPDKHLPESALHNMEDIYKAFARLR